jgi:transcriptional regulator with XRE-family HTH domain
MTLLTENGVRRDIRIRCLTKGSQREVAKLLGISEQYLANVLNGRRGISTALAEKLGYERVTAFKPNLQPKQVSE